MTSFGGFEKVFDDYVNKSKEHIKENKQKALIEKFMQEVKNKYSISLKVKDLIELTGYSQATVYRMLECGEIPGAKKIRGWRIPRDVFIAWWYMDAVDSDDLC